MVPPHLTTNGSESAVLPCMYPGGTQTSVRTATLQMWSLRPILSADWVTGLRAPVALLSTTICLTLLLRVSVHMIMGHDW